MFDNNGTLLKAPMDKSSTELIANSEYEAENGRNEILDVRQPHTHKQKSQSNRVQTILAPKPRHIQVPVLLPAPADNEEYASLLNYPDKNSCR